MTALANRDRKQVEFSFYAPDARNVALAGQFNEWNTSSNPMKKGKDGTWRIKMKLPRGKCEYKYVVDGQWVQDAPCSETQTNPFGTRNCVITV